MIRKGRRLSSEAQCSYFNRIEINDQKLFFCTQRFSALGLGGN